MTMTPDSAQVTSLRRELERERRKRAEVETYCDYLEAELRKLSTRLAVVEQLG